MFFTFEIAALLLFSCESMRQYVCTFFVSIDHKEQRAYVKRRVHDKILIDSVPSETEIQQHEESKHAV